MIAWTPQPWLAWPGSIRNCYARVKHRSRKAQAHMAVIRARAGLVRARRSLINNGARSDEVLRGTAARL
jgi:hypothetical protein